MSFYLIWHGLAGNAFVVNFAHLALHHGHHACVSALSNPLLRLATCAAFRH